MCKVPLSQGWETCDFWIFHSNRVWPLSLPVCSLKVSPTVSQHQPLPSVLEPWAQSTGEKESQDKASGRNPASPCPDSPWPQPPSPPSVQGPSTAALHPPGAGGRVAATGQWAASCAHHPRGQSCSRQEGNSGWTRPVRPCPSWGLLTQQGSKSHFTNKAHLLSAGVVLN